MAYAVRIATECTEAGCSEAGTYEVRNNRNEKIRICCRPHAHALVHTLSLAEERALRAQVR